MPQINPARLLSDLRTLAKIGAYKTGVHRPTLSPDDVTARHWLMDRMREAGLTPHMDGIANVIGMSPAPGPKLLTGSHLESQSHAGWLDGAMGVMFGLEVARAFAESDKTRHFGIDVGAWCDEEGHFGAYLGSRSFIGALTEDIIDKAVSRTDGRTMRQALKEAGLEGIPRQLIDKSRYKGYFEAHIEQGDVLDAMGLTVGAVTSIVGIWQYKLTFRGIQNHAGTTRMAIRRDAGLAAARFCVRINEIMPQICGPLSVWTTGRITLDPGAPNIIPGSAEVIFHVRDASVKVLEAMQAALFSLVEEMDRQGPCGVSIATVSRSTPALMDEGFIKAIEEAAERHVPGRYQRMPSGAGHDAQYFATLLPSVMLFVPSIGGISHHWSENTRDEDMIAGCQVMADACEIILNR